MGRNDRYFMSSVKIGPKGQIVIPKDARDMFGLEPGDTLVLLADKKKGIALQTADKLNPLLRSAFAALPDGTVATLLKPENKGTLTKVLTYHAVAGKVTAADLIALIQKHGGKATIDTLLGQAFNLDAL